jgi:hypothetical protein
MPSQHGDGWSARWNDHEGKRRRMTFRFKRDAEAYERKMKGEQEEIRRGLRGLPPPAKPFEALCAYWIDNRASQKRSGAGDGAVLEEPREVLPLSKAREAHEMLAGKRGHAPGKIVLRVQ